MLQHMPTPPANSGSRLARLFRNGANQAVRIPREFEFEGEAVLLRREGKHLVMEPVVQKGLLETLRQLEPLNDEFPDVDAGQLPLDTPKI